MALPHAADAGRRNREPTLSQFVGDTHLPEGWPLNGERYDSGLDLLSDAVLKHRLLARDFGQRDLAAFVVQLLESIEAIPAIPHHLASLAHIAELLGELQ